MDCNHLYMRGGVSNLQEMASNILDKAPCRSLCLATCELCLRHPWLQSPLDNSHVYKVERGSDMGSMHNPPMSDAAVSNFGETWACSKTTLSAYSIKLYVRFRGDMLAMGSRALFYA